MLTQQLRFIYHLKTSVGVKYVFEDDLTRWLSIRTWGEKVFIASGPSSVHVFSHNGADLSLTYVINPYGSLPPEWHGFVRTTGNRYLFDRHQTNFLPHPRNPDGVFIVLAGTTLESELDDGAFFLVREFNGTTHVATYSCDVWENMVAAMEAVFNQDDNKSAQQELEAAMSRMEVWDFDWGSIHDEWPALPLIPRTLPAPVNPPDSGGESTSRSRLLSARLRSSGEPRAPLLMMARTVFLIPIGPRGVRC